MIRNDFCVFILSYGRPDNLLTLDTLQKENYTGQYYIVCDDEDDTLAEYIEKFGQDKVLIFNKEEIAKTFDEFDNSGDRRTVVYARNYCFKAAKELGIKYFLQLDDDYYQFLIRYDKNGVFRHRYITDLDRLFEIFIQYLEKTPATAIAMGQGGDFIGGDGKNRKGIPISRKLMNTHFCCTDRPFQFIGKINEDVVTPVNLGSKGHLFLTIPVVAINQTGTQESVKGLTDFYLENGTYIKSFYPILCNPSSVKISVIRGQSHSRIHHKVLWRYTVPVIIDEKWRKNAKVNGR